MINSMFVNGCILLVLVLIFCFIRKKASKKYAKRLSIFVGILIILSLVYPLDRVFVSFCTPEDAFYYVEPQDEILTIVEGEASDLVISDNTEVGTLLTLLKKSGSRWKLYQYQDFDTVKLILKDDISIVIYHYKKSSDYYYYIYNTEFSKMTISDNQNTDFKMIEQEGYLGKQYAYCGYVNGYDSSYELTVDGSHVIPFQEGE